MKKRVISVICILLFLSILCGGIWKVKTNGQQSEVSFFAMSTYISLTAYGKSADQAVLDAQAKVAELEGLWSTTDEKSVVYALNHSGGMPVDVDDSTGALLEFALEMAEETDGALEPTIYPVLLAWGFTTRENRIPEEAEIRELLQKVGYEKIQAEGNKVTIPAGMELDFGAVGKGYTGDILVELLKDKGITSALLDLGGNIQAIGSKPDGSDWRVGLRDPFGGEYLGVLEISDLAVVTSGSYERYFVGEDGKVYGHIIDPATGYPAESGLASVTIIAREGKICDALSTALFVMGEEGAVAYWRQHQDFDMILVTQDGEIHLTEGIKDHFSLNNTGDNKRLQVIS